MNFLTQNWEHILAGLGALSILFNALEAGCHAAGWTKYEGIFTQIANFIKGFLGGFKPSAGFAVAFWMAAVLIAGSALADTTPAPTPAVSVTEVLNTMGAQAGYFYGVRAGHGYSYLATKLANVGPASWHLSLDGGLIATSGAAVTLDYDVIGGLSLQRFPVLGFFDTLKVGAGGMVTDITAFSDGSQINKVDNRLDYGAVMLFSKKI